ncbi:MAG: hypothetical protein IKD46_09460 [Lentisphaeria bacterium]|nr:hypothetical protein [Lentisphaeria bacterium]
MRKNVLQAMLVAGIAAVGVFFCGCSDPMVSNTARTAVEQFLLSDVIEQASDQMQFASYKGKKAVLDYNYLAPQVDKPVIQGLVERRLAECGVTVVTDKKEADIIVQLVCPVLATDMSKFLLGTPSLPIPVPDTSVQIVIPEIPLFLKLTRSAHGHFSVNILNAKDSAPIEIQKGIRTRSEFVNWTLLLIPWKTHSMKLSESKPVENNEVKIIID